MSSVSVIQSAEPRPRADNRPADRGGDVFSELLERTALPRDDSNETALDCRRECQSAASVPSAGSRTEALERSKAPKNAETTKPDCDRTDARKPGDSSEPVAEEKDVALAAAVHSDEADSAETQPLEGAALPAEEPAAGAAELGKNADSSEIKEPAASQEAERAEAQDEETIKVTTAKTEVQPDADEDQVEAVAAPESGQASDETSDDPDETKGLSADLPNDGPEQELPTVAAVSTPVEPATEPAPSTIKAGGDESSDAPSILPGNSAQAPRGSEQAPGQQPVHPNPVAAAARENAPPFSDGGSPQQHSQNAHQQNLSPQHDPKPAVPAASQSAEFAQPAGSQADTTQPAQFDLNASAALQTVRPTAANAGPASLQPANAPDANLVPLAPNAIAVEIVSRMREGQRRFDIRLDPPELGRIEVRLDVDRHGNVSTRLTVDRPETLDLMQRDARSLERALQQAGLKTDDAGLQFSLRQQADNFAQDGRGGSGRSPDLAVSDESEVPGSMIESYRASILARGGVDIRV